MSTHPLRLTELLELDQLEAVDAREYLRVSRDASGRLRSNGEQHDDNEREALRQFGSRLRLGEPYSDEGSASRYQRKRRKDYETLISDLEHNTFGARVLILWESSRGTRRISEMARLLELCEERGVHALITTHRRCYDPRVIRDWKTLMEEALDNEVEVRKTSERGRRATNADAGLGTFNGGRRPYGYEDDGITVRAEERDVIRWAAAQLLAGKTTRALAAELNAAGKRTSAGNAWHPGPLATLLRSQRIAGHRVHHGKVAKRDAWPAILDELTHRRVAATLEARRVARAPRGPTPWLLTGLLLCGRCGAPLSGQADAGTGTRRYGCRRGPGYKGCGQMLIKAEPLEELLGDLATERLADVEARRAAGASGPDERPELEELDRLALMRIELAEDYAAGAISRAQRAEDAAALDRLQSAAELRLAAKVREASALLPLDLVAGQGGRRWADLGREEQRARLSTLIRSISVAAATRKGSKRFEAERVTAPGLIDWRV